MGGLRAEHRVGNPRFFPLIPYKDLCWMSGLQKLIKTMSVKGGVYTHEADEAKIYHFLLYVYMVLTSFLYISLLLTCSIRLRSRELCTLGGPEGSLVCCTASNSLCQRMLALASGLRTCSSGDSCPRSRPQERQRRQPRQA